MALRTARRLVVRGRPTGRAAGRTGSTPPCGPDQRFFKTDVDFSNTLLEDRTRTRCGILPAAFSLSTARAKRRTRLGRSLFGRRVA